MKKNNKPSLDAVRHSLAHLLASAVLKKYPDTKLAIGPTIENGFYYDFQFSKSITPEDLKGFEETMRSLISQNLPFSGRKASLSEIEEEFKNQPFKLELAKEFESDGKELSIHKTGEVFSDLCRGGHVENTSQIDKHCFKLDKLAGAYWRGDEKQAMLTRIYGLAFENKRKLDDYLKMREEAEKRDHKKLGPQLDLFVFSDLVGAGLPLWTPKGMMLRTLLDDFVWSLRKKYGYFKIEIPHITKRDLYEKSGHWSKFKDELFRIKTREGHEFAMKPMNCPHHTQIYARKKWSYRELPQRYANTTMVYRDEQSGELAGLSRVRSITQDDAHVFCRLSQAKDEILKIWDIIENFYGTFGFNLRLRLSLHDPAQKEKYLGDEKKWSFAEDMLRKLAKGKKAKYFEAPGEAAFYGPKLDFMGKDSIGREHQVATIQLDVNMPESFNLFCINEKGEEERIVMIHAAIMGSIERFLAVLIEHYAGAFPIWLSPVQVRVLAVSEKQQAYAEKVTNELTKAGIRAETPAANETLGRRIRETAEQRIPYMLVVGDDEKKKKSVSVRRYGEQKSRVQKLDAFIKKIVKETEKKI